jgi:ubiquitin-like-conjugating enzyme ATG10
MFFVHPCNTADAMKQIAGHQRVTPELYLMLWLGLVGNRLGLNLPRELFEAGDVQSRDGGEKGPEPGMG